MSKKHEKYTIEDFITDDDFINWVKYPTDHSDNFWHSLINREPSISDVIQKAKLAVQQLIIVAKQNAPKQEIPSIWEEIEENITIKPRYIFSNLNFKRWVVAASILLLFGLGYWWQISPSLNTTKTYSELISKTSQPLNEIINTKTTELLLKLPDGSKVILEPNSRLSYNESFEGIYREVYLAGEAFFEVKKNPKKPFMVYANGLVTKVLGTSFSIKAFEKDKEVIVNVKTGKVSVYAQKTSLYQDPETNGVVLTPNQKVIFGKADERFTRTLVEKPTLLLTNQELQQFLFKDAPIEQIFSALQKAYGVEIIYDKDIMENCHLTTSLTNENLFEKLNIICAGIEASYKIVDAQVIIYSNGCN